jgi:hypothetical protein
MATLANTAAKVGTGLAGALTVTAAHQLGKATSRRTPRMDLAGRRGIKKLFKGMGLRPPRGRRLQRAALGAELVSNSAYYALAAMPLAKRPVSRGALLGAAAGLGGVLLTPKLGLGWRPVFRSKKAPPLTGLYYLLGGIAAGAFARATLGRKTP